MDIEFIVQILQIQHGRTNPHLRTANTLDGLGRLTAGRYLPAGDAAHLNAAFVFLRTVEKVLRRQDERARTRLPADPLAMDALSRAVGYPDAPAFLDALHGEMASTRRIFRALLGKP